MNFLQISYKLHMNFLQTSYELLTNSIQTWFKLLANCIRTSYKLYSNFLKTKIMSVTFMNLETPKSGAMHELLFKEPASDSDLIIACKAEAKLIWVERAE
jgi:hypothetical protein